MADVSRRCHDAYVDQFEAELRVLKLLPTTSYVQIAATLYISRNTVKTHLRSIYQKLGGAMLETCGSAGKGASEGGCTFPVTECRGLKQWQALERRAGKVHPCYSSA